MDGISLTPMNRFFLFAFLAGQWMNLPALPAADGTWTGATSSLWTASGNWIGGIPGDTGTSVVNSDTATFVSSGATNLTIEVGNRNIGNLVFNDNADGNVTINVGPTNSSFRLMQNLTIEAGSSGSHAIAGDGILRLGAASQASGTYEYAITNHSSKLFTISTAVLDASGGGGTPKIRNLTIGGNGDTFISAGFNSADIQLIKSGAGTLTLAKSTGNTYGGTTINGGTLLVTNGTNSATGTGSVTVKNSGTLGGSGRIATSNQVQVENGGTLLAGNGAAASGSLTLAGNLTLDAGSKIKMVLGPGGAHSTLARSSGTWNFASGQAFELTLLPGAIAGTYDNIITGLGVTDPGVGSWTILSAGITGTFVWDSGNVDLLVSVIPEPSAALLLGWGWTVVVLLRRRRMAIRD